MIELLKQVWQDLAAKCCTSTTRALGRSTDEVQSQWVFQITSVQIQGMLTEQRAETCVLFLYELDWGIAAYLHAFLAVIAHSLLVIKGASCDPLLLGAVGSLGRSTLLR